MLFPVARNQASARRCDQPPDLSSVGASQRLASRDWLQPPSATNKPVKPVRHSSTGVQGRANHSDRVAIYEKDVKQSTGFCLKNFMHRIFTGYLRLATRVASYAHFPISFQIRKPFTFNHEDALISLNISIGYRLHPVFLSGASPEREERV